MSLLFISVLRKPFEGPLKDQCLREGCGAYNIDATRLPRIDAEAKRVFNGKGRWPGNVLLVHRPGCRLKGTRKVKSGKASPNSRAWGLGKAAITKGWTAHGSETYADPDGNETLEDWACESQCAILVDIEEACLDKKIGPSKFFMTFPHHETTILSLLDYLRSFLTPPDGDILVCLDVGAPEWPQLPENGFHGAILGGDTSELTEEIWRVLKPGALLLLIPPEDEPAGFTGPCALEDAGFEVRDSFAVAVEAGSLHYCSKPGRKEKDAGLEERNPHKTVKPLKLMRKLLEGIPQNETVLDPFLGSGTTALAALETGHDFIGIELDPEYVKIAGQRIRHWKGHKPVDVHVDGMEPEPAPSDLKLDDLWDF